MAYCEKLSAIECRGLELRDQPLTLAAATSGALARQWKALALGRPTLDEYLRDQCAAYTADFSGASRCWLAFPLAEG